LNADIVLKDAIDPKGDAYTPLAYPSSLLPAAYAWRLKETISRMRLLPVASHLLLDTTTGRHSTVRKPVYRSLRRRGL